jgi:hypothetical protein
METDFKKLRINSGQAVYLLCGGLHGFGSETGFVLRAVMACFGIRNLRKIRTRIRNKAVMLCKFKRLAPPSWRAIHVKF